MCSDSTIGDNLQYDEIVLNAEDLDIPVSTSDEDVVNFLLRAEGKKIIFSTYQSLEVICRALKYLQNFTFDLTIFDEAHKTAGLSNSRLFSLGLNNEYLPSKKRLFMTATERIVKPNIRKIFDDASREIFSMDDVTAYGDVLSKLTFGEAIRKNIVSDYRIVIAGVDDPNVYRIIRDNNYLMPSQRAEVEITADNLFKPILLLNAIKELTLTKVVTFHSRINESTKFSKILELMIPQSDHINYSIGNVQGSQTAIERIEIFEAFEKANIGIISNVRCMTEGVDIPIIDAVYFADPRNSLIDIVQAVGRALRQPYGEIGKIAYIIIPILIPDNIDASELVNIDQFDTVYTVIQALRDQDENLAELIDKLNLTAVRGQRKSKDLISGKIIIRLPQTIDAEEFEEQISVRIADVNRNPEGSIGPGSKLGKNERISTYRRIFKTIGDYNVESYSNLVISTIGKFNSELDVMKRDQLLINHNNISHTEKLGVIRKTADRQYELTVIGRKLLKKEIDFKDVFRNQMMLYSEKTEHSRVYPYRTTFRVMATLKSLSYRVSLRPLFNKSSE